MRSQIEAFLLQFSLIGRIIEQSVIFVGAKYRHDSRENPADSKPISQILDQGLLCARPARRSKEKITDQ
jgi:hypothetical protein